jgi:hypothetical protein
MSSFDAARYGAGSPFDWPVAIGYERAPLATLAAVAGPLGVAIGIFGWIAPNGTLSNSQVATSQLAFVLPVVNAYNWQRVYQSFPADTGLNISGYPTDPYVNTAAFPLQVVRAGYPVVGATVGVFNTRFPFGAQVGNQVWTDPATGLAYASNVTGGYIATPWTAMGNGQANAVIRISSFIPPLSE